MSKPTVLERLSQQVKPDENEFCWFEDDKLQEFCPNLFELLFAKQIAGRPRDSGTLVIWVDGGRLKAMIKLPSEVQVGFLTLDSLRGACMALEDGLVKGTVDWRADKNAGRSYGKR